MLLVTVFAHELTFGHSERNEEKKGTVRKREVSGWCFLYSVFRGILLISCKMVMVFCGWF